MKDELTGEEYKPKGGMDLADLYDHEIAEVDRIGRRLAAKFARKSATFQNLEELVKEAHAAFLDIGLIVEVDTAKCLILGEPPEVMIIGKVPGHSDHRHGFDHDRKRHEILKSKKTGEKYLGQQGAWTD